MPRTMKTKRIYQKVDQTANRTELLRMARAGEPRPKQSTRVGRYLSQMSCPAVKSYWDEDFYNTLRLMRPDWFKKARKRVVENKADLFELAEMGAEKPHMKTKLGTALHHYCHPKSATYDPEFRQRITELRPDWFFAHTTPWKRAIVRQLAKSGADAPDNLYTFTRPSASNYDEDFHEELMELRPDWFVNGMEKRTMALKEQILEIARSGAPRPGYRYKDWNLYTAFRRYTMPDIADAMFDAEFFNELYALRPEWFIRHYGNTAQGYAARAA